MAFLGIRMGSRVALLVFGLIGALLFDAGVATAAGHARGVQAGRPLNDALSASGRIRPGVHGSFNARGYRLVLDRGGAPRFVKSAPPAVGDSFWSESFGNVGVYSGTINAVAVSGSDIYIGGSFSTISYDAGIAMNNVAEYDGHGWIPLGTAANNGVNGEVFAVAASGSTVYVGGQFTSASGVGANAIAKWNGTSWSGLQNGMTDPTSGGTPNVDALALSGSTLYAGGQFQDAGGSLVNSIAKWTGSTWSALGTGIQDCIYFDSPNHCYNGDDGAGTVNAIAVSVSTVYVGGSFNQAGGMIVSGLATWTGSAWSTTLGSVISGSSDGAVNSITLNGSSLYVGGRFDHVGGTLNSTGGVSKSGTAAASVAQWNGTSWHWLGAGAVNCNGCGAATVDSVAYWNGHLYMSGNFYGAGGDGKPSLAQWNGSAWSLVGPSLDAAPSALLPTAGGVLAVGGFGGTVGGAAVLNHIGLWNGTVWSGYGLGLSYGANAGGTGPIAASNHVLYAGGNFYNAGWTSAHNLAEFDGTSWHTMGTGLSGGSSAPYAILVSGKDVYVGGSFTQAGSTAASNIAMWDGSAWHALGSGLDGTVRALALYNGKLWVGGSFAHAGSVTASDVAIWDPATSSWSAVAGGALHYDGTVDSLAGVTQSPYNHYMVIAGNFGQLDSGGSSPTYYTVNSVVYVDTTKTGIGAYYTLPGTGGSIGATTNTQYGPIAGTVNALLVDGLNAYLGGSFSDGGNVASNGLVAYNLNTGVWSSPGVVGGGSSGGSVNSLLKVGTAYFVAGDFTTAGTVTSPGVAKYTPATKTWSALGSGLGVGPSAFAPPNGVDLAQSGDGLYVSGGFGLAGGKAAENLALWTGTAFPLTVTETESPSPVNINTTATFTGTVKNTAGVSASGVTFTATLPSAATFESATATAGSCTDTGTTVNCTLGALAAGASDTVTIKLAPTQLGPATVVMNAGESGSTYTGRASTTVIVTS